MISIFELLEDEKSWNDYLEFKRNQSSISKKEIQELENYIKLKSYKKIVEKILKNEYEFSIPKKHLINKINKTKKRVVYNFNEDETMILKVITYLFSKKYDDLYSDNCFSFRKKYTVKDAIYKLSNNKNISNLCGYKTDISNYFNSIDIEILLEKLKSFIGNEDCSLFYLIEKILRNNKVEFNGEIIEEYKGIMAGIPISSFLANIYLNEIDEYFKKENILYIRYSDDIIFFAEKDNVEKYMAKLNNMIEKNKLLLNPDKIQLIKPNEKWEFLGFSYQNGIIDISNVSKKKIKDKIKRSAKKLRRWMLKNNASPERAISAVIRKFNRKFYMIENKNELTWQLWYFPVVNTAEGLHEIDVYMQNTLRYIATGKYSKKNYNIKYEDLKKMGYRPLVSEYYKQFNNL